MKDLTTTDKYALLGKIKSFLHITWEDDETDNEIWGDILTSINRIDEIAGADLDYLVSIGCHCKDESKKVKIYNKMSYLGQDLLKNRVFYIREKGLDDFEKNYRSEVVSLYNYGRIYKSMVD